MGVTAPAGVVAHQTPTTGAASQSVARIDARRAGKRAAPGDRPAPPPATPPQPKPRSRTPQARPRPRSRRMLRPAPMSRPARRKPTRRKPIRRKARRRPLARRRPVRSPRFGVTKLGANTDEWLAACQRPAGRAYPAFERPIGDGRDPDRAGPDPGVKAGERARRKDPGESGTPAEAPPRRRHPPRQSPRPRRRPRTRRSGDRRQPIPAAIARRESGRDLANAGGPDAVRPRTTPASPRP